MLCRDDFNWLSATGTGCFFAAIARGVLFGLSPLQLMRTLWTTLVRMRLAMIASSCMLGLGFVTRYSGLDAVLGLAFTRTGWLYPFFGTFLGWLGVALTGSDTSANALFGSLHRITSQQLGIDPVLMCAGNSAGGVMGKWWTRSLSRSPLPPPNKWATKESSSALWRGTPSPCVPL